MTQKLICMTKEEWSRYEVINNLIASKINGTDASKQIGVTIRHIVANNGADRLIHKNRNQTGNRKLYVKIVKKAKKYLKEKYYFCNPTFASEKLAENYKIKINKETVRIMITELKLWKPKSRKKSGK